VPGAVSYNPATNIATFTPTGPLANGTNYTVTVTTGVRDVGGNPLAANFISNFTTVLVVDVIAPTVVSVVPSNGVSNVATNTQVTVTFSEPMNPTTINSTNVQLTVTTGAVVSATVTYNAGTNAAVITPTSPLANGTTYTVRVTTAVRDVAGNPLAAQFTSTFTTVADTTSPTVVATTPVNNATSVPVSSTVTVTFSEDMNPSTINGMTFSVRPTTGVTVVTGVVSYNVSTRIATFTPTSALTANTNYTATVTTGARDLAGNGLTGNFTFFFTTAP
ncbi:MAG: Ig-like domain-containing protein, partial [Gemmatimonadaceae bacterium]|nr:Ig-like domain-containing protein [Gemmatimonadaceae bacterium]